VFRNHSLLSVPLLFLHLTSYSWKQFEVCLNVSFIWDYSTWCAWLAQLFYCRTNNTCLSQSNTQSCGWCVAFHLHLKFWIWVSKAEYEAQGIFWCCIQLTIAQLQLQRTTPFRLQEHQPFRLLGVQHNPTAHHTRSSSACTACPPSVLPFSYTPNHYYLLWGPKNARRVQHALLASSSAGGALKKKNQQVVDWGQEMRQCEP
jgi:hypothetical protein